jgi:F1F0 ATPase subunit 2
MNDGLIWALAGVGGGCLGLLFFGGLWWTVRHGLSSRRPALWFLGSLLLRLGLVVTGFYFVGGGEWKRLLACALGFIGARFLVTRLTRPPTTAGLGPPAPEARHAP